MTGKEEVSKAADKLNERFSEEPYDKYVLGCGISTLQQKSKQENIKLKEWESLDDLCIAVILKEEMPSDLECPSKYEGFEVFYIVTGEFYG